MIIFFVVMVKISSGEDNFVQKFIIIFLYLCLISGSVYATTVSGGVEKNGVASSNRIVDAQTNTPVADARVALPKQNYTTYTDSDGAFALNTNIKDNTIMSVEKEGYKPFSLTLSSKSAGHPLVIGIEKTNGHDMQITSDLIHLGDNNFSDTSANAGDFRTESIGPSVTRHFKMTADALSRANYLVIGSIVGIDTMLAKSMGQNQIKSAYSSPPEIYFNGNKIAEIKLNGDGQRVKLPRNLIRPDQINEITIRTGKNLAQHAYIDYDDIEFMNLSITSD